LERTPSALFKVASRHFLDRAATPPNLEGEFFNIIHATSLKMKPKLAACFFLFLGILAMTRPVVAHHGSRVSYDMTKMVTVKGVLKEFHFVNPHVYFTFNIKDNQGHDPAGGATKPK
jgi:hypothetical protein